MIYYILVKEIERGFVMELQACLEGRKSIRRFTEEAVPHEVVEKIVKAASASPSWKNTQVVRYTVVENKELIQKIGEEGILGFKPNTKTIVNCPSLVVQSVVTGICGYEEDGSFTTSFGNSWEMYDAGISAQSFMLAAHEQGVGTVVMGIIDENKIAEWIDLPEGERVTALIAMGYQSGELKHITPRKEVSEILRYK